MLKRAAVIILLGVMLYGVAPVAATPDPKKDSSHASQGLPFKAGEKLTYEISWSNVVRAGKAEMEVRNETGSDGRAVYHIISRARSAGLVKRFYKVSDTVESVIDGKNLRSLSYRLDQNHGKRHRKRTMTFNPEEGTVLVVNNTQRATYSVPDDAQDALSSLYYVRSRTDFTVGKPILVNVHEDGKTWAVEVHTLGKELIKTPAGEFNTVKLKTYPKYEGVFQNKGEIFIWLTDDSRRVPVLMKSTISIGSIVSTLVEMKTGEEGK
jgi:hypothetical protein